MTTAAIVSPGEMIRILMEDNGHIAKMIRDAINVCDENRDSPTSNLLQDILDKTERRKWFLYERMQGQRILNNSIGAMASIIQSSISLFSSSIVFPKVRPRYYRLVPGRFYTSAICCRNAFALILILSEKYNR